MQRNKATRRVRHAHARQPSFFFFFFFSSYGAIFQLLSHTLVIYLGPKILPKARRERAKKKKRRNPELYIRQRSQYRATVTVRSILIYRCSHSFPPCNATPDISDSARKHTIRSSESLLCPRSEYLQAFLRGTERAKPNVASSNRSYLGL